MTVVEIKEFLKIDVAEDEILIQGLLLAAKLYLTNAGVAVNNTELYNLAVKLLVCHWYENRNIIGKSDKIAFSLDCIITQLQYSDIEYNEAIIKLIEVALSFNTDAIQSIIAATDLLIQAGGIS